MLWGFDPVLVKVLPPLGNEYEQNWLGICRTACLACEEWAMES